MRIMKKEDAIQEKPKIWNFSWEITLRFCQNMQVIFCGYRIYTFICSCISMQGLKSLMSTDSGPWANQYNNDMVQHTIYLTSHRQPIWRKSRINRKQSRKQ